MSRWEGWLAAILEIVAVAGILSVLVRWCERAHWQWDSNPDARYTLPAEARAFVEQITEPVHLVAFVRSGIADAAGLRLWLPELARHSPAVTVEVFDIDREPTRARRYGVDAAPAVVVETAQGRAVLVSPRLPAVLASVAAAVRTTHPHVFLTSGSSATREHRRALEALRAEGFRAEDIEATAALPRSRYVLLALDPNDAFLPWLATAWAEGNALLLALEPNTCSVAPRLCQWLAAELAVHLPGGTLIDARARLAAGDPYTVLAPGLAADHPITAALQKPLLLSQSTPVDLTGTAGNQGGWTLLFSSQSARLEVHEHGKEEVRGDADAPFPLAVAGQRGKRGRFVVVGDADWATDFFLDYAGNRDFLLNAANWLADEHVWSGPRVPLRTPGVQVFFLTASQAEKMLWAFAVGEPALLALCGAVFWWRRQRR
ncbi:MAG: hypothetical protein KatS3mg077_0820 [Candidatus Binatia bacterium]|nr:MAG: hypothetical protein KatS3mg077_0820 [Candidatus Binatia bacterium]